ncbi:hypothetical protein PMZ80_000520 [Knufia obscura]|uniref:2',3'-cyclic-nucleotide 3'-phosphodiesterase n=2 Tax=Knufia TaxID=430999 RepID=A0AAN8I654_9EURO|nr:hypothetical protein PMZ80_000520 [Knufia obscura]KAK5956552.1 hypothetical protein OHC33_002037 [Knufia fluminis]
MSSSLWLIPTQDNPFTKELQELITTTIPSNFAATITPDKKHTFIPHVTLTTDITPKTHSPPPQQWLDNLSLPPFQRETNEVPLELSHLEAGDTFHRKLSIAITPHDNLSQLAARCRREAIANTNEEAAQSWAASDEFRPHLSLLYADVPRSEVQRRLPMIEGQLGWSLGSLFDCCGGTLCFGGEMVLVETGGEVDEWRVLARRETPWVIWRMGRGLI